MGPLFRRVLFFGTTSFLVACGGSVEWVCEVGDPPEVASEGELTCAEYEEVEGDDLLATLEEDCNNEQTDGATCSCDIVMNDCPDNPDD